LATSDSYRDMSDPTKRRLGWFSDATRSGEATWSSSADCLFGRVVPLNQLLVMPLANLFIVLAAAALVLGIICIIRNWQARDSNYAKDLTTLGLVSANQYLPSVAAACAIAIPCYRTQTEVALGVSMMVYSTSEVCEERSSYIAMRAPVLALAFAAGPILWSWLIHRRRGDDRNESLRFLTASYRPESEAWEANRLAKTMLLRCAVAVAPISYCAGLQLVLVMLIMFSFTALHIKVQPYKFAVLNNVEAVSLWVLNLNTMASSLVVNGSWFVSTGFAQQLIIGIYGLLAINSLVLAALFLWAKFIMKDSHEFFKT